MNKKPENNSQKEVQEPDGRAGRRAVKAGGKSENTKVRYVDFSNLKKNSKDSSNIKISKNSSAQDVILGLKPEVPVYFSRPSVLKKATKWFLDNFKGFTNRDGKPHNSKVLYSVKSNPDEKILRNIFDSGVRHFDVASLNEIKLIRGLFGEKAKMYYMHPVKPRESIAKAYFEYGIRDFSLDSDDELKKIQEVTKKAKDLNLCVRLAIPNLHSAIDLSGKFGIRPAQSVGLIRKVRGASKKLGICFHVGSQCMDPTQYRSAILIARDVVKKAGVKIDVLDIGGGFPSIYPSMTPPQLIEYIEEIRDAVKEIGLDQDCDIWCEPGRALVAESGSLLVRVEGRKGNMLYINDGTYGGLFDAGFPSFIYPCKTYRISKGAKLDESSKEAFGFYGPTCDSMDVMKGPFYLPKNIKEGDYIEIGQLGSYSKSLRTNFNGFNEIIEAEISDRAILSLYDEDLGAEAEERLV